MIPFVVIAVAAAAGGAIFGISRARASSPSGPVGFIAKDPVGYRRLRVEDPMTAEMAFAQSQDMRNPFGLHFSHEGGAFMTAVENPTGLQKQVVIFVPTGSEYLR